MTLTIDEIKNALNKAKEEREQREKDYENGVATRRFLIQDVIGDTAISKKGREYPRVVVTYRDVERDELKEKKMPQWDPQAELIVNSVELGSTYDVQMQKDDAGYWKWIHFDLVTD